MENENKIYGGAILLARQVIDSEIFTDKPDVWFKIWIFILAKANHETKGKFKRGQCFLKYDWIEKATRATRSEVDHCIRWLKSATMLATQKTTRGMIITVIKYDFYQTLDNYYYFKSDTNGDLKATQKRHRSDTINKNDKNDKNDNKREGGEQSSPTPQEEVKDFFLKGKTHEDMLTLFSQKTPIELVRQEFDKFALYWTEPNKMGTKVRWEQQGTFEIKRRLFNWFSKIKGQSQSFTRSRGYIL